MPPSFRVIGLLLFFSSSYGPWRNEVGDLVNSGLVEKGTLIQGEECVLLGTEGQNKQQESLGGGKESDDNGPWEESV